VKRLGTGVKKIKRRVETIKKKPSGRRGGAGQGAKQRGKRPKCRGDDAKTTRGLLTKCEIRTRKQNR